MVCHYCYLIALKPSPMTASSNLIHHIFASDEDSTPMKDVMVGNDLLWKQCVHVRSVRVYITMAVGTTEKSLLWLMYSREQNCHV